MNTTTYAIASLGLKPILFVIILVSVLPFAIVLLAMYFATGSASIKIPIIIGLLTLPVTIFLLVQFAVVTISTDETYLTVGGGLYKQKIVRSEIRRDAVRTLDPSALSKTLGSRVNGIGLPGFLLGWFQPHGGRKVFVLQTTRQAVLVPTSGTYDVVVTPADTHAFISDLQKQ